MSDRDQKVVVKRQTSNVGALVAGIVAVLLIAAAIWYIGTREGGDDVDININIPVPTTTP